MKNIKYFVLALLSLTLLNCSGEDDNGQVVYSGAPLLNFLNQGGEQQLYVISNTTSVETIVKVGTFSAVSGSHTVKIVPDLVNSTAVLGVDYVIHNDTDVLENGESNGEFKLEFFKDPALESGKKVIFRLESDLPQAIFNTQHVININLACPVEALVGKFESNTYWYGAHAEHIIEQPVTLDDEGVPLPSTQIIIKGFWFENTTPPPANSTISGADLVLGFDENFEIGNFTVNNTGRFVNGREVRARRTTGRVSRFNPCTRIVTLYVTYLIPRASGGFDNLDQVEVFTGVVE